MTAGSRETTVGAAIPPKGKAQDGQTLLVGQWQESPDSKEEEVGITSEKTDSHWSVFDFEYVPGSAELWEFKG